MSAEALADAAWRAGEELPDDVAREIAGQFASPGSVGHVLAAVATGATWELSDLLDDIAATRRDFARDYGRGKHSVWRQLDQLATWAMSIARDRGW